MTRRPLTDEELAGLERLQLSMQKMQVAIIRMAEAVTEVTNSTSELITRYTQEKYQL